MASLNRITQKWHAYIKEGKKRVHLGYYRTKEDAVEAEELGHPTEKRWTRNDTAEAKAVVTVEKLIGRKIDLPGK